jgi:hypothetical protein
MIWALLIFCTLAVLVITNRIGGNTYVGKALLYLDIFVSSLVARDPGITISSYCALTLRNPNGNRFLRALGRMLNTLQPGHCESALIQDLARAQLTIKSLS